MDASAAPSERRKPVRVGREAGGAKAMCGRTRKLRWQTQAFDDQMPMEKRSRVDRLTFQQSCARSQASCLTALSKLVPDAPHRMDVFGILRIALDLRAQAVDVRVDRMIVPAVLITPNLIEELLSAVDAAWMARKMH